ncbi:MAG: PmoA family protein [Terriglobia bacterium]|jgi:hypothetical protein
MRKQIGLSIVSALLVLSALARGQTQPVEVNRSGNHLDVLIGGKPFATYYFDPAVAKPYLQPLRSAQGTIVTRGFPNGNTVPPEHARDPNLEPHQRPLAFAHGNTDGLDFWEEEAFEKGFYGGPSRQAYGKLVFQRLAEAHGGPDSGVIQAEFNMVGPGDWILGEETQRFTFRGDEKTRIIDCEFTLHASHGPLIMGDSKEGTFGIRVAEELNSPPGIMVNSLGGVGEKEIWGKRADWVDYFGVVAGEAVGIAIFDHPQSFRHPTWWHARHYGLFAANPFGIREFTRDPTQDGSWAISDRQSLALRYRVLIHHGDYREAKVAEAYHRYAAGE